jgi:hypothetical protein
VQELVTIMRELGPGTTTVTDIEHVQYVDALGGKRFIGSIASELDLSHGIRVGVGLCNRLESHRLTVPDGEPRRNELAPSARSGSPRQRSLKAKGRH